MTEAANNARPRLLIIGARGFLGSFLTSRSRAHYHVVRADRTRNDDQTDVALDLTDVASVTHAMNSVRPDAVMLLAALPDIDRCQREPDLARAVNLEGAEHVANACAKLGARLLFTSTGAVFDGLKIGYREDDPVSPVSVYGETKALAEIAVQKLLPSAVVARVSLVLGRSSRSGTNSFIDGLIRRWKSGQIQPASIHEARNPIDAATLSDWLLSLTVDPTHSGTFHTGSTEAVTRYELARALAARLNVPETLIHAESQSPSGRAPRGIHQLLLSDKLSHALNVPIPTWEQAVDKSLATPDLAATAPLRVVDTRS